MEPTDIELMLRAKAGDIAAFHGLTQRYREPLRRFFVSLIADRSQAEDFVQETFLRLWLTRSRYEPTGRFSTYLFQIGKHYWFNQRKKFRPNVGVDAIDATTTLEIRPAALPETALLHQDRAERIRCALTGLPEHYRAVFELSHLEGLKYAEVGQRLGIPVGTVKSRMAEAIRRLRLTLSEEEKG